MRWVDDVRALLGQRRMQTPNCTSEINGLQQMHPAHKPICSLRLLSKPISHPGLVAHEEGHLPLAPDLQEGLSCGVVGFSKGNHRTTPSN